MFPFADFARETVLDNGPFATTGIVVASAEECSVVGDFVVKRATVEGAHFDKGSGAVGAREGYLYGVGEDFLWPVFGRQVVLH